MVFSSLNFLLIFLPIVLLLHSVLPFKYKNIVLLAASIIFYAWGEPVYVILMILSIGFNYMSGLVLGELEDPHMRKRQLIFAVAVNLLLLGFFKYAGFLVNMINAILPLKIEFRSLALPVGISFYTFQALSYVIDVYRKKVKSQENLLNFAVYITMFPQLVAGPIVKYSDIELQLIFAVAVNLLLLGFFKYAGFLVNMINAILPLKIEFRSLALPVGISFYTFQALSYVIDVYRKKVKSQENLLNFAVYITMFPQLVAGPIVKYSDIELQLSNRRISRAKFGQGIERLLFGLSKKVLLANNLGLLYETIQASGSRSIMTSWLGIFAYTLQIYFDFSGYSDMAIGMGKMLGFTFPENFNFPYISDSITEFWRRWHMTLSGWFREYVYIPLGGNRVSMPRHILNLLIVWVLTGFWHGAAWNFILWGLYYGILLILEKYIFAPLLKKLPKAARHIYTMLLVMFGWVLFSNTDFGSMRTYVGTLFGIGTKGFLDLAFFYYIRNNLIILIMGVLCATPLIRNYIVRCSRKKPEVTSAVLLLLGILSIAFLVYGTYNPFLYFRF